MAKPLKNKSPNHISPLTDFIKFKEEIIKFKKHYNKTFKPKLKKKVTKPKAKKMPEKLTLPANAQLKHNLLCNTGGSNKFYQIYVAVMSEIKNSSGEKYTYNIYTGHGRVGAVPVIGIHFVYMDDLQLVNQRAQLMADAKLKKGYKAQAISGFKTPETNAIGTKKKSDKKNKLVKTQEVEQQIKIDNQQAKRQQGTGRFSLINLD